MILRSDVSPQPDSAQTGEAVTVASQEPPATESQEATWIDAGHKDLTERANAFAVWVDEFFGHARAIQDSPRSIVRIRPQFEWDEQDDTDWKIRATGRLHLPRTSDRLSAVFLGQDSEFEDEFYDPGAVSDGDSTLGLEYRIEETDRHDAYLFVGIKAGPKGKLGARYRYQVPFMRKNRFRFSEELFWVSGDGFGALTRADIDRTLSKNTLLRWANKALYSEESNGVEWSSRVSWINRLEDDAAFRVFTAINGETDPGILRNRGFGVGYRSRFLKEWLYWEVEPSYSWRKRPGDEDREGVAMVKFRLEVIIGER